MVSETILCRSGKTKTDKTNWEGFFQPNHHWLLLALPGQCSPSLKATLPCPTRLPSHTPMGRTMPGLGWQLKLPVVKHHASNGSTDSGLGNNHAPESILFLPNAEAFQKACFSFSVCQARFCDVEWAATSVRDQAWGHHLDQPPSATPSMNRVGAWAARLSFMLFPSLLNFKTLKRDTSLDWLSLGNLLNLSELQWFHL